MASGSRTPAEILAHIGDLLDCALSLVRGAEVWRDSAAGDWQSEVQRFFDALTELDAATRSSRQLQCPWPRLFQGPLADAFTHVGQLAMLRRLAGSAIRGENYFRADIAVGRVGPDQAGPQREFE